MAGHRRVDDDDDEELTGDEDFRGSFREDLERTLNMETWAEGLDLQVIMERYRQEIGGAIQKEDELRSIIRQELLPRLQTRPGAPEGAGLYQLSMEQLADIHSGLLFAGQVEAVNGLSVTHETLPLDITQLSIAAIGYGGTAGTFSQRLFRREVTVDAPDPYQEALSYIEMRQNRSHPGRSGPDSLSRLARRGIRAYAERAILVEKLKAPWRMGQGNPFARELITGSGYKSLLKVSLGMLGRLMKDHPRFVFVSARMDDRGFLTMGHALRAGEFVILESLEQEGKDILTGWQYDLEEYGLARDFINAYSHKVVKGLFRASENAPPRIFYAHVDHAHMAACVAIADSMLRPEQGYPMLLDVAESTCRSTFGMDGFEGVVQEAYALADAHLQYFNGRKPRR
ncbi:hypothetical protein D7X30_18590 [Corallococcus sp. AB011P]|uniref:hypothetical protein n=1 Tax=unclassified Corallococcus TaxID=2685029 RepID=UPI000EA0AE67|nr:MULTISPECIES: hypothetical protein [unclassified Corallococcus]RKG57519.1 hypothetical protein D7X30_18590 [Corallococcus sp. AB011P]RKH80580.1 hypothetical protein D7Y21_31835 [Corallococcus sp. AB045]